MAKRLPAEFAFHSSFPPRRYFKVESRREIGEPQALVIEDAEFIE